MPEKKDRERSTKRKVNLVSSHNEREGDGPLAACSTEGRPADDLYRDGIPTFLKYHPKAGETVVYEAFRFSLQKFKLKEKESDNFLAVNMM